MRSRVVVVVGLACGLSLLLPVSTPGQTTTTRTDRLIASTQAIVGGTALGANTLNVTGTLGVSGAATFAAGATFDTDTLVVDAGNNRVGVGVASPTRRLHLGSGDIFAAATSDTAGASVGVGFDSWQFRNTATGANLSIDGYDRVGAAGWRSLLAITNAGNVGVGVAAPGSLLTIDDAGDLSRETYASQTTGWRITRDGAADFRYLYTDELHAKVFIADLEQALAGSQIVSKSVALVHQDFVCPTASAPSSLIVRDLPSAAGMAVFQDADWVVMRTFSRAGGSLSITDCVGTVVLDTTYGTSGFLAADSAANRPATQRYQFTRGGTGCTGAAGSSGTATSTVTAETLALDYGTSGAGYAEVNAIDGLRAQNSPYYQLVTWTSCPVSANRSVRARYGNLSGAYNYTAGSNIFGLAVGDAAATNLTIDPTNGIRIRYGTTDKLRADTSGNLNLEGDLIMGTGGAIRSGATSLTAGTGYWLAHNGGTPQLRIGAYSATAGASSWLAWDGTSLTFDTPEAQMKSGDGLFVTAASALATSSTTAIGLNLAKRGSLSVSGNVASVYSTGAGAAGEVVVEKGCGYDSSCAGVTSTVRIRARHNLSGLTQILLDAAKVYASGAVFADDLSSDTAGAAVGFGLGSWQIRNVATGEHFAIDGYDRVGGAGWRKLFTITNPGVVAPGADATQDLGASGARWSEFYVDPTTTTSAFPPLVLNASGQVLKKTDGVNVTVDCTANGVATIAVEEGIVTNITCR